jgi:exonuclease III
MLFQFFSLFLIFYNNPLLATDTECPYVNQPAEDRRENKTSLRLMQYNAEWLFIDHYSAFDCPGSQCTWKNESEAEKHLSYVANVIKTLNPDILNLCEVEGCDELNMLQQQLSKDYAPYLIKGTDTGTGQNVGLLTKVDPLLDLYRNEGRSNYPIPNSNCGYTGVNSTSGVSKHYITEFLINNMNIAFISAHLIAIPTDPARCSQREAQAQVLQNVIFEYINRGYEIVMIGDFNDYDAEVLDMNNNVPISKVLDILKGTEGVYNSKYDLYSVAEKVIQKERFSDWWDSDNNCNTASINDYSMIDHILVTEQIKKYIKDVFFYHGYKEYCGKYNSDHYPVIVDFLF